MKEAWQLVKRRESTTSSQDSSIRITEVPKPDADSVLSNGG